MHLVPRYNRPVKTPQPQTRSGSGPSDAALVVAARANESWAKEALFRRYVHLVNGLAYRVIGRDEDLDDLVQDSFTEAWRSLHRLDNPQVFSSWLCSIVVRTAHKLLRRRKLMSALGLRHRETIDLDALIAPSAPQDVLVELRAIYAMVETLPTMTRVAFVLRRVEGVGLEEIATMLGVSLATVKRRIADAERQLELWCVVNQQPLPGSEATTNASEGS
jgi:RNA polymerase sigma-70 factor (ECF subfamily)